MIFVNLESELLVESTYFSISVNIANYNATTFSKFNNQLVFEEAYT